MKTKIFLVKSLGIKSVGNSATGNVIAAVCVAHDKAGARRQADLVGIMKPYRVNELGATPARSSPQHDRIILLTCDPEQSSDKTLARDDYAAGTISIVIGGKRAIGKSCLAAKLALFLHKLGHDVSVHDCVVANHAPVEVPLYAELADKFKNPRTIRIHIPRD